jgi:Na+/melibiose symporter-like transporter
LVATSFRLTAPVAILFDSLSFLWSAFSLSRIRSREIQSPEEDRHLWREIRAGLRFVTANRYLRPIAINSAATMLFQSSNAGIMIVFLVRDIHLAPGAIGLLSMLGLLGAIAASFATESIATRLGNSRTLVLGSVVNGLGFILFALTTST